jgi:hypothetical protein
MSKILLTGMTAPQASYSANTKNVSFAFAIYKCLTDAGHTVVWQDPEISINKIDLEEYDSVLVGISPVTSLSANRVYGALNIIDLLWKSSKLRFFIDAPNTAQIASSLKSIDSNPISLMKDFYSYRKGYSAVISDVAVASRISNAISKLVKEDWPTTIYPSLPWKTDNEIGLKTLPNAVKNLAGLNLDSYLLTEPPVYFDRREKWVVDSHSDKATAKLINTLSFPTSPMKWNKGWTDAQVLDQISRSAGVIISPYKSDGTWWSYRYVQAINSLTPIYTSWTETSPLGASWSYLAPYIEDLGEDQRFQLATEQRSLYVKNIPTKQKALEILEQLLNQN